MTGNERRQLAAWGVLPVAAALNGGLRDATYGRRMGETAAHSLAVAPLLCVVRAWARALARRWPLPDRRAALRVGLVWLALTLAFESGLGRARGMSMREIAGEYDLRRGKLWALVPVAVALAPVLARRGQEGHETDGRGARRGTRAAAAP